MNKAHTNEIRVDAESHLTALLRVHLASRPSYFPTRIAPVKEVRACSGPCTAARRTGGQASEIPAPYQGLMASRSVTQAELRVLRRILSVWPWAILRQAGQVELVRSPRDNGFVS